MIRSLLSSTVILALAQAQGPMTVGATADRIPEQLRKVAIEQRLGDQIPLDTEFVNAAGNTVTLADIVGERPMLLVPVYYDCPMLCGMVLETLTKSLKTLTLEAGRDFDVIAFSFDPSETTDHAAKARRKSVHAYDAGIDADTEGEGWHFLVGDSTAVERLTDAIGFRVDRDESSGEFAHAAAVFVLTPDGRIARVFFGLSYSSLPSVARA